MDVALVKHAEDDVDDDERRRDQIRRRRNRLLKGLGVALKASHESRGRLHLPSRALDRIGCLAKGCARSKIEADGHGRELALMIHGERRDRTRGPSREGGERHLLAGEWRAQVEAVQDVRVALHLGQNLEYHVIAVELREVLREVIVAQPVYRTYVRAKLGQVSENDVLTITESVESAKANRPDLDKDLFDFFRNILLLRVRGECETELVTRFQNGDGVKFVEYLYFGAELLSLNYRINVDIASALRLIRNDQDLRILLAAGGIPLADDDSDAKKNAPTSSSGDAA